MLDLREKATIIPFAYTTDEFRALLWALYSMYVRFDYLVSHNYPGLMN